MQALQNCVGNKAAARGRDKDLKGVNFYESEDVQVRGTNGKLCLNVKRRKCKQLEHYQNHFPKHESDGEEEE